MCNFLALIPHPSTLNASKGPAPDRTAAYIKSQVQEKALVPTQEAVSRKRPASFTQGVRQGVRTSGSFTSLSCYESEKDSRWPCEIGHVLLPGQIT